MKPLKRGIKSFRCQKKNSTIFSDCQIPCAYILECRSNDGEYLGVKVGSAANFQQRYQNIKISSNAKNRGVACLRPIAIFPADIEKSETLARYDAYSIENILHKFCEKHFWGLRYGNDYYLRFLEKDEYDKILLV